MFRNDEQKIFRVEAKQREFLGLTQRAYAKTTNPAAEDLSRKEPTQVTGSQYVSLLMWRYSIIYKHVRLHSQHPGMQVTHRACLFFPSVCSSAWEGIRQAGSAILQNRTWFLSILKIL